MIKPKDEDAVVGMDLAQMANDRRLVFVRNELEQLKEIKNTFGGTVNDVVLTVVAGALRRWLRSRGVRTEGLELRAMVPVNVRNGDAAGPGDGSLR